jgi:hypothetical protein
MANYLPQKEPQHSIAAQTCLTHRSLPEKWLLSSAYPKDMERSNLAACGMTVVFLQ